MSCNALLATPLSRATPFLNSMTPLPSLPSSPWPPHTVCLSTTAQPFFLFDHSFRCFRFERSFPTDLHGIYPNTSPHHDQRVWLSTISHESDPLTTLHVNLQVRPGRRQVAVLVRQCVRNSLARSESQSFARHSVWIFWFFRCRYHSLFICPASVMLGRASTSISRAAAQRVASRSMLPAQRRNASGHGPSYNEPSGT